MKLGFIFREATKGLGRNLTMTIAMIITTAIAVGLVVAGIMVTNLTKDTNFGGHANEVPQPRGHSDDGCEDDEEPEWIRQLIANLFHSAQEAACRTWFFFSFGFGHCIGTFCRSVGTN